MGGNGRRRRISAGCAGQNACMHVKPGATTAWPSPAHIRAPTAHLALWARTLVGIGLSAKGTGSRRTCRMAHMPPCGNTGRSLTTG